MRLSWVAALLLLFLSPMAFAGDTYRETHDEAIRLLLDNGDTLQVDRVRLGSMGFQIRTLSGRDSVLSARRVKAIEDEQGTDRTKYVLGHGRELRVGDPDSPGRAKGSPFRKKGTYVAIHGSYLGPLGGFADVAEPGYSVAASILWRTSHHDAFGVRLERAEFGADPDLESNLSSQSGGGETQLRFQLWIVTHTVRYLIAPDHHVVPFVQITLGLQGLRMMLNAAGAEGSHMDVGLNQEIKGGLDVQLGRGLAGELSGAYTFGSGKGSVTAGVLQVSTGGTNQYLQVNAAIVRRLGSKGRSLDQPQN